MSAFHWRKAAPGMYYLFDRPSAQKDKALLASAKTFSTREGYQIAILLGAPLKFVARCGLRAALARAEAEILLREPKAVFSRDNF